MTVCPHDNFPLLEQWDYDDDGWRASFDCEGPEKHHFSATINLLEAMPDLEPEPLELVNYGSGHAWLRPGWDQP